ETRQVHAVEGRVPPWAVGLKEFRRGMGSRIYGVLRCHAIVGDESIRPLRRPVTESLLVHVQPPEFDTRSVLEHAAAVIADSSPGGGGRLLQHLRPGKP